MDQKEFCVVIALENTSIAITKHSGWFWKRTTVTTTGKSFINSVYKVKTTDAETAKNLVLGYYSSTWNRLPVVITCYEKTSSNMGTIESV
jgi:hypothetical protein